MSKIIYLSILEIPTNKLNYVHQFSKAPKYCFKNAQLLTEKAIVNYYDKLYKMEAVLHKSIRSCTETPNFKMPSLKRKLYKPFCCRAKEI